MDYHLKPNDSHQRVNIETIAKLKGHEGIVWNVSWHPKGNILATCGQDKIIRIWKQEDDDNNDNDHDHDNQVDQSECVVNNTTEAISLSKKWKLTDELCDAHKKTVRSVSFSPCGRRLAAAGFDGIVSIWVLDKEKRAGKGQGGGWSCVANLEGHENEVKCVAWSPDGKLLATCGRDKTVWIWEINPGDDDPLGCDDPDFECLAVLAEHSQDVKKVVFSPMDSRTLISTSYDDTLKVWRAGLDDEWICHQTLGVHSSTVWSVALADACKLMVSVGDDRSIVVLGKASGSDKWEEIHKRQLAHDRPIYDVDIIIFKSKSDSLVKIDDMMVPENESNGLSKEYYCPEDITILSGGGDKCVKCWELVMTNDQVCLEEIGRYNTPNREEINCISVNPKDSTMVAIAGDNGHLEIVSINRMAKLI